VQTASCFLVGERDGQTYQQMVCWSVFRQDVAGKGMHLGKMSTVPRVTMGARWLTLSGSHGMLSCSDSKR